MADSVRKLEESIRKRTGKREYGENGRQKKTQKKQAISAEYGWNSRMRTKFYSMSSGLNAAVLKDDMTDLKKRPKGMTKKDIRGKNNHAEGIWSDSRLDKVLSNWNQLIKFVIERDEKRRNSGFYEKNPNVREIKKLKDINHHDVRDFIDYKLYSGTCQPTTVRKYLGDIKKGAEATAKDGIFGHKNLVRDYHEEMIPDRDKDFFVRGRGETDGKKGYTLEQANKLIKSSKDDPYFQAGLIVFTDIGIRKETFFKLKWSDVLSPTGKVNKTYFELFESGLLKGGREQIALTTDRATTSLQELWATGNFKEDEEIFGRFTEYTFSKELKNACEETGVDYKGFHEFRAATVEFFDDKAKTMTKEELADQIMKFVDIQVPHRTTGELYKPHNPIVLKKVPMKRQKRDSNGKLMFYKNRKPMMEFVKKRDKDGNVYVPMKTVTDKKGQPVYGPKWTKEELIDSRIDFLRNLYTAEQISHNRPDANSPYRHG